MASPRRIVHLPFKDPDGNNDGHVLVRVSPKKPSSTSSSPSPLDLELLATQGREAFVTKLHHDQVSEYRNDDKCSQQDWEQHLISVFVDLRPSPDLDILAETEEKDRLTITIRKKASSGRAQRLGTLRLRRSRTAEDNTDVFDWCVEEVIARTQLEKDVEELRRKQAELERLVAEETAHFQELERSKREFEALHDSLCRDLINEKKLKVRQLERVLSTAQVDQDKLSSLSKRRSARAGASSIGKRKAEGSDIDALGSDKETDDGVDKMNVDDAISDRDISTASESEQSPASQPKNPRSHKNIASESDDSDDNDERAPPRKLPVKKKPMSVPDPADDESTASE